MNKGEENIREQEYDQEIKMKDGRIERHGDYFANEHPVMFPFGPPVYLDKLPEPVVRELDVLIEHLGGKPEFDASGQLAGRIKKQTHLTEHISNTVQEQIITHCNRFYHMVQQAPQIEMPGFRQLSMQIQSIWSNIQEAREYNPPHSHSGDFSFVIYCRNDLEKYSLHRLQNNEYDSVHNESQQHDTMQNTALAGLIELQYGEPAWMNWTQFRHVPSRGDIIIFPNWLRHTVYAHYEANHIRVSVAGNVNILNVETEDNIQKHT